MRSGAGGWQRGESRAVEPREEPLPASRQTQFPVRGLPAGIWARTGLRSPGTALSPGVLPGRIGGSSERRAPGPGPSCARHPQLYETTWAGGAELPCRKHLPRCPLGVTLWSRMTACWCPRQTAAFFFFSDFLHFPPLCLQHKHSKILNDRYFCFSAKWPSHFSPCPCLLHELPPRFADVSLAMSRHGLNTTMVWLLALKPCRRTPWKRPL